MANSATDKDDKENKDLNKNKKIIIIGAVIGILLLCLVMCGVTIFLVQNQIKESHKQLKEQLSENKKEDKSTKEEKEGKENKEGKEGKEEKEGEGSKLLFYKFFPSFLVNLSTKQESKYLEVDVSVMTHDPKVMEKLEEISTILRGDLILLYSSTEYESLLTSQGKEDVRLKTLELIKKGLKDNTGLNGVEQVYFTKFVIQ